MGFDIWNSDPRKVKCVKSGETVWGGDNGAGILEVGKLYTVKDVDVRSWHTEVFIEEHPNIGFNSVLFEEV